MEFRKFLPFLPLILVLVFTLYRAYIYLNYFLGWNVLLGYDDAIYALLGQKFIEGDFYSALHPYWNPGLPLFAIPFYFLTGSWEKALILLSMIAAVLMIPLTYLTLKKYSIWVALLTSFIVAVSPVFEKLTLYWGFTEPIYILFFWLAVFFGFEAINDRKTRDYFFTGLFFGIAFLIRTEVIVALGIFVLVASGSQILELRNKLDFNLRNKYRLLLIFLSFVALIYYPLSKLNQVNALASISLWPPLTYRALSLFILLILILSFIFRRNKARYVESLKAFLPKMITVTLIFLLVNLPHLVIISLKLDKPVLSGKYSYVASGYPFSPEKVRYSTWAQDVWSVDFPNYESPYYDSNFVIGTYWKHLESSFEAFTKLFLYYLDLYGHDNTFSQNEIYLAILGILASAFIYKLRRLGMYLFAIWGVSFVWIILYMAVTNRYLAYSFALVCLSMAIAVYSFGLIIVGLAKRLGSVKSENRVFLTLFLFFSLFYLNYHHIFDFSGKQIVTERNRDQKEIGEWLKSNNTKIVMARTEGISLYSGAKLVYLPAAEPEYIAKYAKFWNVDYIIARPVESSWDYMIEIVNSKYSNPSLSLAHRYEDGTLIWKVNK